LENIVIGVEGVAVAFVGIRRFGLNNVGDVFIEEKL
jgi:hypothetical protein